MVVVTVVAGVVLNNLAQMFNIMRRHVARKNRLTKGKSSRSDVTTGSTCCPCESSFLSSPITLLLSYILHTHTSGSQSSVVVFWYWNSSSMKGLSSSLFHKFSCLSVKKCPNMSINQVKLLPWALISKENFLRKKKLD
jgi:hypothetical protein